MSSQAGTRLDDSLSPRQRVQATTGWVYDGPGDWNDDQMNALVANVNAMEFRLNTAPYIGKTADIYLTVPGHVSGLTTPTAMRLDWTTRGRFASGSLVPGTRALVWHGKIVDSVMSDYFDFRIYLDARNWGGALEFDPVFEIDLAAP